MSTARRQPLERDQLIDVVRATFGPACRLVDLNRLRGGTKKGVYRLTFADESTAILYAWAEGESYWPAALDTPDETDPFADASGADLFEASQASLTAAGVRTPQMLFFDRSRGHYPADIGVVEDVRGDTLETLLETDPGGAKPALERLRDALMAMRQQRRPRYGKVRLVEGGVLRDQPSAEVVLKRARLHLAEAASRDERVTAVRQRLENEIGESAAAVQPREEYSLIHGELGPDHVLVDDHGDPVIIDIEGAMFFDVEWEHVFLEWRFHDHYRYLQTEHLDEQRMRFYRLAMHLALIAGPLALSEGDYPERDLMLRIAESHLRRVLTLLD